MLLYLVTYTRPGSDNQITLRFNNYMSAAIQQSMVEGATLRMVEQDTPPTDRYVPVWQRTEPAS